MVSVPVYSTPWQSIPHGPGTLFAVHGRGTFSGQNEEGLTTMPAGKHTLCMYHCCTLLHRHRRYYCTAAADIHHH